MCGELTTQPHVRSMYGPDTYTLSFVTHTPTRGPPTALLTLMVHYRTRSDQRLLETRKKKRIKKGARQGEKWSGGSQGDVTRRQVDFFLIKKGERQGGKSSSPCADLDYLSPVWEGLGPPQALPLCSSQHRQLLTSSPLALAFPAILNVANLYTRFMCTCSGLLSPLENLCLTVP